MIIDTQFDMYSDTPSGKDPDKFSPTLRQYHLHLWSKTLPDGTALTLSNTKPGTYLYHRSELGTFHLSSDAFSNTFQHVDRLKPITSLVPKGQMAEYYSLCSTIGAYIVFPGKMIDRKQTINMARGCHPRIRDRIDLSLECIRRHYAAHESPLSAVLDRYKEFFALYQSFERYVDHFLLNDIAENGQVRFFLPFDKFNRDGFPADIVEYEAIMQRTSEFVRRRNTRIAELYNEASTG